MPVYDSIDDAIEARKHIYRVGDEFKWLWCPHDDEETTIYELKNFCPTCGINIDASTTVTHPEDDYWTSGYVPI